MKNYEIKDAMSELSLGKKITIYATRIAFLVQDVHRKLTGGFAKKLAQVKVDFKQAAAEAVQAKDEYNVSKITNVNETIAKKDEKIVEIKRNANLSDNEKNYIIKAYESDIERLRNKTIKVANAPRRLLISKVFIQKLFANRKKRKAEAKALEATRAEEMLSQIPTTEEIAPEVAVKQNVVPTPVASTLVEPVTPVEITPVSLQTQAAAPTMNLDLAIQKYVELNNQWRNLKEEKRVMQEKIASTDVVLAKYEEEMRKLAVEYNLTQEMVEAKYTR